MADIDTLDYDDVPSGKKETETPFSEEFSRIDAIAIADPERGIKSWEEIGIESINGHAILMRQSTTKFLKETNKESSAKRQQY